MTNRSALALPVFVQAHLGQRVLIDAILGEMTLEPSIILKLYYHIMLCEEVLIVHPSAAHLKVWQELSTHANAKDHLTLPIYMDHNATTPVDPRVKAAMDPLFGGSVRQRFGAAPMPLAGRRKLPCAKAREQVAALVGCEPRHMMIWTSKAPPKSKQYLAILRVWCARFQG